MLCLKQTGMEIIARGPVLRADDFAQTVAAREIIARAEAEAARIRAEAEAVYREQKERGYREGLEQGKAEMAECVVNTLGQSTVYLSKVETTLVDVVIKAVRRVIGEFEERERVERIVREALELLHQQSQVRLKVAPAHGDWMQTRVEALLATFPRIQFLDVKTDHRLPADGCILETEFGVIDATVETQLRAIEKALVQALR